MYFSFDFGWYSINFDIVRSEQRGGGGGGRGGRGGLLLNRQNPLSVTKVICRQPLTTKLFDRFYLQNCKAIAFRKIAIIPNENKLMFQVIFIFSD